jgi:hypothetical protein
MMEHKVLIGIPVKNCGAWIETVVHQIINLDYYKENISIVFVENDSDDYSYNAIDYCVNKILSKYNYRSIIFEKKDIGFKLPHESRHDFRHMKNRMNSLRIIRNHIVDSYLKDNDYVWWVDADYRKIPYDILKIAMSYNKDLLMPRVEIDGKNYDGMTQCIRDGKVFYIDQIANLMTDVEIYPMNLVECASFISRKVFESGLRYDSGWVTLETGEDMFLQEGPFFSYMARKRGFELYGLLNRIIEHQEIFGKVPYDVI